MCSLSAFVCYYYNHYHYFHRLSYGNMITIDTITLNYIMILLLSLSFLLLLLLFLLLLLVLFSSLKLARAAEIELLLRNVCARIRIRIFFEIRKRVYQHVMPWSTLLYSAYMNTGCR